MPIYEFGYRGYDGPIRSRFWRWTVIARQGVRLALRGRLLRRLLFLAWTPMLYFALVFFAIGTMTNIDAKRPAGLEQAMESPEFWDELWKDQEAGRLEPGRNDMPDIGMKRPEIPWQEPPPKIRPGAAPEEWEVYLQLRQEWLLRERARRRNAHEPGDPQDRWKNEQRRQNAAIVIEQLREEARREAGWMYRLVEARVGPRIALRMVYDAPSVRTAAWTACFYYYFTRVQGVLMMLVVTIVAPALIANDLRGRSFLIYFSSAITRSDYILGKLAVVVLLIASATLLPGIALYVVSIAFAPSIGALTDTYHILFSMIALLFIVGVPAGLASLYLSSVTTHPRFAAFSWIAIWVMGLVFYEAIAGLPSMRQTASDWAFLLSPYHVMMTLTEWVFNVRGQLDAIGAQHVLTDRLPQSGGGLWAATFVITISVLSIIGLQRRTSAPVNV